MADEKKIFAIIAVSSPDKVADQLKVHFPENYLSVGVGQWLLIGPVTMTTQELSKTLSISVDNSVSNAIVLSVGSYYGRAPLSTWEWLTAKLGGNSAVAN